MSEAQVAVCGTCPRHCRLAEGQTGFCRARRASGGVVVPANYGCVTSLALDPIEKKPLAFYRPGSRILSVGSHGCNFRCPFCQNASISQSDGRDVPSRTVTPCELAEIAESLSATSRNAGLAYTYNEPLVGWEFVRDCAIEIRARGLANVLVSNGCANRSVIDELAPLIDAANIDLKGPSQDFYDWIGGDFAAVCETIRTLHAANCHLEITTLVIPGKNDSDDAFKAIAAFIESISPDIPLHITRFFPRFRLTDSQPTPIPTLTRLANIARQRLSRVLIGNC